MVGESASDVVRRAEEDGLRLVRFLWCGNDGTIRTKASGIHGLEGRIEAGIGLTVGMSAMNSLDGLQPVEGLGPVGEVRLVPDPATFVVLPYAPRTGAMLASQQTLDGRAWEVCSRSFLARMAQRLADERGGVLEVAFENEFSLAREEADGLRPLDRSLCFSTIGLTAAQAFADDLVAALDEQGIRVEQYYAEQGPGQQEVSVGHLPALQAADRQVLVREAIRGVAASHGLVASLAPKPWPSDAGNGNHVHFSLWDPASGRNRFHDPSGPGALSAEALAVVAGVLEHLPGLCGLTAPSFNSYRRIQPRAWAGAFRCWGIDNREAPLRAPSGFRGREEASANLELKASDASANPYLAVGGLIAAALDGLERRLRPPRPVQVDPADLPEARGPPPLPRTQDEALDALEADGVLMAALGEPLARSYLAVRRSEWAAYSAGDAGFEQRGHFSKY
ncbi:MAG: glutamine synthetase [Miltoncostaeaceae bacterium]|nr:glutamine synthetase [Miltoncostaeaceae bacterium]